MASRPPVSFSGRGRWKRMAEDLQVQPGEWVLADTFTEERHASSCAGNLRRHGLVAAVRRASETNWDVWASYPEPAG